MAHAGDSTANAGEVAHARSLADPVGFWGEAAALIDWVTPPETVLDDSAAPSVHLADWLTVRPNLQYIRHPGGVSAVDDALIAGLKIQSSF